MSIYKKVLLYSIIIVMTIMQVVLITRNYRDGFPIGINVILLIGFVSALFLLITEENDENT